MNCGSSSQDIVDHTVRVGCAGERIDCVHQEILYRIDESLNVVCI